MSRRGEAPQKNLGAAAFDQHYAAVWGGRWHSLREALLLPPRQAALFNPFASEAPPDKIPLDERTHCYFFEENISRKPASSSLKPFYFLDYASVFPVLALDPQPGEKILDLCAAPGGKALLSVFLSQGESHYTFNEFSPDRFHRLRAVMQEYLPGPVRARVQLTQRDATRWGLHEKNIYDRILLDAPCSSERHWLHAPQFLKQWKPSRTKMLAQKQYALLCSAFDALKPGGRLVYSTCALSPLENDVVIDRMRKRCGDALRLEALDLKMGEATGQGLQILPDRTGWGPIFLSSIKKQ